MLKDKLQQRWSDSKKKAISRSVRDFSDFQNRMKNSKRKKVVKGLWEAASEFRYLVKETLFFQIETFPLSVTWSPYLKLVNMPSLTNLKTIKRTEIKYTKKEFSGRSLLILRRSNQRWPKKADISWRNNWSICVKRCKNSSKTTLTT